MESTLEQRDVILDACRNPPRHHVDVVTEITMEDGMMVMNGSKPTDHSEDMLSKFIDLITNAINAPTPRRR